MTNVIITNSDGVTKKIDETNYTDFDDTFQTITQVDWEHNHIHFTCENCSQFYLIPQKQKLVILYLKTDPYFPPPGNLVIHNPDKSVHWIARVPAFINETVIETSINPDNSPEGFSYLKELIEIDGLLHLIVGINTYAYMGSRIGHCTMIEERALNIDTGKFHPFWNKGPIYW